MMTELDFETRLQKVYNGAVHSLGRYLNEHATMQFHCDKCGADFYNKTGYMVGRDSRRHVCGMPYGDYFGKRLSNVRSVQKARGSKKPDYALMKNLDDLIDLGYPTKTIAGKLGLPINVIRDYVTEKRAVSKKD